MIDLRNRGDAILQLLLGYILLLCGGAAVLVGHRYAGSSPRVVRIGQAYVIGILCATSGAFLILNYWPVE